MVNVILGGFLYKTIDDFNTAEAARVEAVNSQQTAVEGLRNRENDLEAIKTVLGHAHTDVGRNDPANASTLLGAINDDIAKYGGPQAAQNVTQTFKQLRTELNNALAKSKGQEENVKQLDGTILALRNEYQQQVNTEQVARDTAERDKQAEQQRAVELTTAARSEIDTLRQENTGLRANLANETEARTRESKENKELLQKYVDINQKLQEKLDNVQSVSFERPDGHITNVDYVSGLVWIDLGEVDQLRVGTTFSIYQKDFYDVARDASHIKGAIEVTRILGPHLSEARITGDDLKRPITAGDLVHTPVWTPGQKLRVALAGYKIDIDNDGTSDRQYFHELVTAANGVIDNEILEDGTRKGTGIDEYTNFLVVADVPSPQDTTLQEEEALFTKIYEEVKKIKDEARTRGVRVISINDFLSYMGYKPSRRVWRPGQDLQWTLEQGSRTVPPTDPTARNRLSGNKSTGTFTGRREVPLATDKSKRLPTKDY